MGSSSRERRPLNTESASGTARHECPVCGLHAASVVYAESRDYITNEPFQVLDCSSCHLAWTSPVPVDLEPHYPRYYRRYNPLVIATLTFFYRRRIARWCRRVNRIGSALEFGCGDGFMLNALRDYGWKVAGTERTEEMARFAREQLGITVYVESQNAIPAEEKFDLIVMFQVLEHLEDPVAQLSRAARLLADGGSIVVGVPNFGSWQARYGKSNWLHLDVPRHLVHFSPVSIDVTARKAGLRVHSVDYASLEHDPYGWVQSVLNNVFGNGNRLTSLLMRSTPWRLSDIGTAAIALLLTPPAILVALISWCFRRGAMMEVVLVKE
jgi:SAM-dependent methyltransferase